MPVSAAGSGSSSSGGALGWACQADDLRDRLADLAALPVDRHLAHVERVEDALYFPPVRNGSTEYTLPSTETVAVLRTCRITLHENASFGRQVRRDPRLARGEPRLRRLAGLRVRPGVVLGAEPGGEQGVQLVQAADRVPRGMSVVAGDLGQELLLDSLEYPFYLAAAHRPPGLAVGQLDAEHRARPLQRRIDKSRSVIGVERPRTPCAATAARGTPANRTASVRRTNRAPVSLAPKYPFYPPLASWLHSVNGPLYRTPGLVRPVCGVWRGGVPGRGRGLAGWGLRRQGVAVT